MVALYTAYLPRSSPRDESLSNKALSLKWRWYHGIHVVISIGDDSVYNRVSALGDVTKTRHHLHRADAVYLGVVISRDDGVHDQDSSPEMMTWITGYYHQRWLRILWGIISRDNGWENEVSSLLYRIIPGSEMTAYIMRYHLQRFHLY